MNCRKVSHLLSAYIDGELPGVEHRQVHEHLARCAECSKEYAGLLDMKRLLARMRVQEPRADLPRSIFTRVEVVASRVQPRWPLSWFLRIKESIQESRLLSQGVALGACVVVLGVLFLPSRSSKPADHIRWTAINAQTLADLPPTQPQPSASVQYNTMSPVPIIPVQSWPGFGTDRSWFQPVDVQSFGTPLPPLASTPRRPYMVRHAHR